jgi:uncharacterized protein
MVVSRRRFVQAGSLAAAAVASRKFWGGNAWGAEITSGPPLEQFDYGDVLMTSDMHEAQLRNTHSVLMSLSEDSLLKPFRQMSGMPAPGEDMGGWYDYLPDYDSRKNFDHGFCPGCTYGQWVSALARSYAINKDEQTRQKVIRLNRMYAETISEDYFIKTHFPAYTFDKNLLGLLDSHTYVKDPQALAIANHMTDAAMPHLPGHAVEQGVHWRVGSPHPDDPSWYYDESYTLPENLFLAYERGAGQRYYDLGKQYLYDDGWFDPLSRNENVLNGKHAYSHVNSMSSAMMAYMVAGSEKHLHAAQNGFAMVKAQSFVTGGWGPDERLRAPGSDDVYESLTKTHASFETPCGSYAHFKITRYLLRVTRDSRYGDTMERMMYNTVLGAKPLEEDGHLFYYSDYNFNGKRVYKEFVGRWACCSGTLPQVAADYRINTYFRGPNAVYVNLYIPSTLRWTENGASLSLMQEGEYPFEDHVSFTVTSSTPTELALNFRIPEWAEGAQIFVNGTRQKGLAVPGQFAAIRREWATGDRVELELPLKMRLETIDDRHTDTAALLRGPIVLMAAKQAQDGPVPQMAREQLLGAKRVSERQWEASSANGPITMLPFTSLGDLPYTTYVKVV